MKNRFVSVGTFLLLYSLLSLSGIFAIPYCSSFLEYLIPGHFVSFLFMLWLFLKWQKCYRKEEMNQDENKAMLFRWVKFLFRIMMVLYAIVYLLFLLMMFNHEGLVQDKPYQIPS